MTRVRFVGKKSELSVLCATGFAGASRRQNRLGTNRGAQSPKRYARVARAALLWFDKHQRDLPWRKNKSRYRVWISEIMLQQTQVSTVIPYFRRFVVRFPGVRALAAADEAEVLRLWEGLGYYRRARQLQQAARIIVERHGARCPDTLDEWLALPGIGRYTAGAILSISDDQRLPILEANTIRLHSRLLGLRGDPRSAASLERLWEFAESVLPARRAGEFNQALMEIGSQVCLPRDPDCPRCPLRGLCAAHEQRSVHLIPRKAPAVKPTRVRQVAVVIRRGDRILMRQCESGQRFAGLWDVARFDLTSGHRLADVPRTIHEQTGLTLVLGKRQFTLRHGVTRFQIDLHCYAASRVQGRLRLRSDSVWKWVSLDALTQLPLNVTARRIVERLELEGS